MKNLAGDKNCDVTIIRELEMARIPIMDVPKNDGEVPFTKTGNIKGLEFYRSWYYWSIDCRIPLAIAKEIYKDPACTKDVRAGGYAGGSPPEQQCSRFSVKTGKHVVTQKQYDDAKEWAKDDILNQFLGEDDMILNDDTFESFVTTYHIDTELGLRVFIDFLRQYKLIPQIGE